MVTGLRASGASTGSAVAFFLGNPALNPAVLVFLVLTLGWGWAALRLVLALVLVLGTAALAARVAPGRLVAPAGQSQVQAEAEPSTGQDRHRAVAWLRSLVRLTVSLVPEYVILVLRSAPFGCSCSPRPAPSLGTIRSW